MNENVFIPTKCKVGFNTRTDTYTGKLGYIIAYDGKKWRKEPSWENWREKYMEESLVEAEKRKQYDDRMKQFTDPKSYYKYTQEQAEKQMGPYSKFQPYLHKWSKDKSIEPIEFDNEPTEGFVLNKKVGGDRYSWNPRQTYTRVYDPRGFEFEITVPNLLYILENTNSIKGKGLEGNFIYGWSGKDLLLIPESAPEYVKMKEFTELQDAKVSAKDLRPGGVYLDKQQIEWTYLGKFDEYTRKYVYTNSTKGYEYNQSKKYWFSEKSGMVQTKSGLSFLAKDLKKDDLVNYNNSLEKLEKSEAFIGFGEVILEDISEITEKVNYRNLYFTKDNQLYSIYYNLGYDNSLIQDLNISIVHKFNIDDTSTSLKSTTSWYESKSKLKSIFPEFEGKKLKDLPKMFQLQIKRIKLKNGKTIDQ